jgi:hypothetical protein
MLALASLCGDQWGALLLFSSNPLKFTNENNHELMVVLPRQMLDGSMHQSCSIDRGTVVHGLNAAWRQLQT